MKKMRILLASLLAMLMCAGTVVAAFASEPIENDVVGLYDASGSGAPDDGIMPYVMRPVGGIHSVYKTVATSRTPIQKLRYEVVTDGYNGWVYQINLLCFDANDNVVREFRNASGVFASGELKLFDDHDIRNVVRIDMSITPRVAASGDSYYGVSVTY